MHSNSKWVWSLSHDITTSLRLHPTPIFIKSTPGRHRHNRVSAHPYASLQHTKVLKQTVYGRDGSERSLLVLEYGYSE